METFPLNDDWTVEYFEPNIDGFEMAPSVQAVPRLPQWQCEARFAEAGFYAWLQRRFVLSPSEMCVRYVLQVEHAPSSTKVYVNDQHLLDLDDGTARIDITDYVSLGVNRLSLRVACPGNTRFDAVLLLQIPCEDA